MSAKIISIGDSSVPVTFGDRRQPKALPLEHPKARYPGFKTETKILPKGWTKKPGSLPLPCDILFEKDVPITLSDGTVLYVDIFRPPPVSDVKPYSDLETSSSDQNTIPDTPRVPAILAWSPYGKAGLSGCQLLSDFPFRLGIPAASLSELQKWEGPDPAYWVQYGYAVVNADARGAGMSGGDICVMGSQEGRDGKEVVEWIGEREWCSGRVGLGGNSWLATAQWFIAAEKPKHLACIAPWEGMSNLFTEVLLLGGVPPEGIMSFLLGILALNAGTNSWENPVPMALKAIAGLKSQEELKKYFEDKRARIEDIEIPAYVVASWGNPLHTYGTFRAFQLLKRSPKWLRVHDSFEWPDFYSHSSQSDLHRFFDYYLKGIENNWPLTPQFRAQTIDTANPYPLTGTQLSAPTFPLPENLATPLKVFLSPDQKLDTIYPRSESSSFSVKGGELVFEHTFDKDIILCGAVDMHIFVSLHGELKDADLHVSIEKVLTSGKVGGQLMIPFHWTWQSLFIRTVAKLSAAAGALIYKGPYGCARVSQAFNAGDGDEEHDVPGMPVYTIGGEASDLDEELAVEVTPCIQPIGMRFAKGEKLRVKIKGSDERAFQGLDGALTLDEEDLKKVRGDKGDGEVKVHFGGEKGSWIEIDSVAC